MLTLTVVAFLLVSLLAGMHLSGVGALNPALRSVDGPTYLVVKQAADREFPKVARPLMLGSLLVSAATTVTAGVAGHLTVALLGSFAVAALAVTLTAILRGDLPLNRTMASWSPTRMPDDWVTVRARWEKFFLVRVGANAVAVVLLLAAVLAVR